LVSGFAALSLRPCRVAHPVIADQPVDLVGLGDAVAIRTPAARRRLGAEASVAPLRCASPVLGPLLVIERPASGLGPELAVELATGDLGGKVGDGVGIAAAGAQELLDVLGLERLALHVAEALGVALGELGPRRLAGLKLLLDPLAVGLGGGVPEVQAGLERPLVLESADPGADPRVAPCRASMCSVAATTSRARRKLLSIDQTSTSRLHVVADEGAAMLGSGLHDLLRLRQRPRG
jgi:hypothetical protein